MIAKPFSQLGLVIPSLIFIAESTIPLSWSGTPRVSNVKELELLRGRNVLHSEQTVRVIERDTIGTSAFLSLSVLSLLRFCAADEISTLEILFHLFPEDAVLEGFTRLRRREVELLRDTT